jgi:hypothetical protein
MIRCPPRRGNFAFADAFRRNIQRMAHFEHGSANLCQGTMWLWVYSGPEREGRGVAERERRTRARRVTVWWADLLWGFWNGLTAWIVLVVHVFGGWEQFPFYNEARSGNWYDFGFLLGAGSPLLGAVGGSGRRN